MTQARPAINSALHEPTRNEMVGVLFCTDEKYAPYTGVAIRSLVEHFNPSRGLDIIVFEDGLSRQARENLEKCAAARPGVSIAFLDIEPFLTLKASEYHLGSTHISKAAYYRLSAPIALADRDKIVYLDSDVIVLDDISELHDSLDGREWVAACVDFAAIAHHALYREYREYMRTALGIEDCNRYFNTGVLAMHLQAMRSEKATDKIADALRTNRYPRIHDQDILNTVCANRIRFLDHSWNYAGWFEHVENLDFERHLSAPQYESFVKASHAPKIVHYNGPEKPWYRPDLPWASIFWEYARKTPFYERLLTDMTRRQAESYKTHQKIVVDGESLSSKDYLIIRFNKALAKYRMYYVLSLFTAGNLRRHFMKLRDRYKVRSDHIRSEKARPK